MTPSERARKWNRENPERSKQLARESAARIKFDPERLRRRRESLKRYYARNPEKMRQWRNGSEWARMADRCRSLLRGVIYGLSCRGQKSEALLGCTGDEFREYIKGLWESGMTWENFGRGGWTLSHIKACAVFRERLLTEEGRKECFHFSNIKPEWEWSNRAKHVKSVLTEAQEKLK